MILFPKSKRQESRETALDSNTHKGNLPIVSPLQGANLCLEIATVAGIVSIGNEDDVDLFALRDLLELSLKLFHGQIDIGHAPSIPANGAV